MSPKLWALIPPSLPIGDKKNQKVILFLYFIYKYFFRTQTGVTMQKNGFNKKCFSGHAEYFLQLCEKKISGRGVDPTPW